MARLTCLVTGGSGFIGSHVVDRLRELGHEVRIFDLHRSPYTNKCECRFGSILDIGVLQFAMEGIDVVFHLAAVADVNDVFADPLHAANVNATGTMNVLEVARRLGTRRVIYGSTSWVYSDTKESMVDEDTPIPPPSHLYTATKLAGEHYCRSYAALYNLQFTILRYGIPYGPRSRGSTVIASFVEKAIKGDQIVIDGDGSQFRQFIYVKDLAKGNVSALVDEAAGKTYNLDGARKITIKEIAESVSGIFGGVEIRYTEKRPGDFKGKEVLIDRARKELGWSPDTDFDTGLAEYVHWHKERAHG